MQFRLPSLLTSSSKLSELDVKLVTESGFMDATWYKSYYYDLRDLDESATVHYLTRGAKEGRDPSPDFSTSFYLATYPDVAAAGVNPLLHYLRIGRSEGRRPSSGFMLAAAVDELELKCIKPVQTSAEMAIIVSYARHGVMPIYAQFYVESYVKAGISPILIIASDDLDITVPEKILGSLGGAYIRQNDEQDFSAWAHIIQLNPLLLDLDLLIFCNDRFIGPIDQAAFEGMIERVRGSTGQAIGLTDGYSQEWHIEPYWLAFRSELLRLPHFRRYIAGILSYDQPSVAFRNHAIPLMQLLRTRDISATVLFPVEPGRLVNRTVVDWRELISEGFPFVNLSVLFEANRDPAFNDLETVVSAYGYDLGLTRELLTADGSQEPAQTKRRRTDISRTKRAAQIDANVDFSPKLYNFLYPDVARAGMDPLYHFRAHGQSEGRIASLPGETLLADLPDNGRETILIVSHDGSRTGSPILSLNMCRILASRYNVVALFLGSGPMLESFRDAGIVVVGPVAFGRLPRTADNVLRFMHHSAKFKFAVANSVESRAVLAPLARLYIPSICLIHEFGAYTRSRVAFRDAIRWAGETVFSAPITRDDAIRSWPVLAGKTYPIIPQGRCLPPQDRLRPGSQTSNEAEIARLRSVLRPDNFPQEGLVVIGVGTVQLRKGVDLFIACAVKTIRACPDVPLRFVWVGAGFRPNEDFEYSAYLSDQIKRSGVQDQVLFAGETTQMDEVYSLSDVLLITSRLDPLPNVAIEAMDRGMPVICFNQTTGFADVFADEGLVEELIAEYLDVDGMADKLSRIIRAPEHRRDLSLRVRLLVQKTFDMSSYVSQLEKIAQDLSERVARERADVETIAAHRDYIRFDYCFTPQHDDKSADRLIREYVRSWAAEVDMRKLAPGFHPGVYLERHGVQDGGDPLADFLRSGRPDGPWSYPVISSRERPQPPPRDLRVGLHIHAHYPELVPEMIERLKQNRLRPDLLISINDPEHERQLQRVLRGYGADIIVRVTPNRGRDIGAFLTEFRPELTRRYDVIGHLHTKKTADLEDRQIGRQWYRFLLDNLLGWKTAMADIIIGRMAAQAELGLVFADDPHVVGWDANRSFIEPYVERLEIGPLPKYMHVPIGTMFWARPQALEKLFDLALEWHDYPPEPLPYDGSLLHGLERLFGIVTEASGYSVAGANCPGVTR